MLKSILCKKELLDVIYLPYFSDNGGIDSDYHCYLCYDFAPT